MEVFASTVLNSLYPSYELPVHPFLTNYEYTRIERVLSKSMFLFSVDSQRVHFVSFNHFLNKSDRRYTCFFFGWQQFCGFGVFFVVIVNTQQMFTVAEVSEFVMNYNININKHVNFIQFWGNFVRAIYSHLIMVNY